ncbi:TIGR02588 family protein [Sinorhizobium sp. RAC02]|uniref:TIGR02588 family protein n=1 Tax=Sinorhizobium sp. RAC02 TaxID=1842534 RepID=UPI00083D79E7|nr:TIGR02588 family protein [Sinorhizobium sp. RAC02]AOF88289.1 putative transmembrane protein [Sinorhizobium sp. RAC02]
MTKSEQGRHRERHDPHWIEWLTGIVSALLVAGLLGWIGWEAFTREATPPDLTIAVLTTEKTGAGYRVAFDIRNAATTTAASVTVIGRLMDGDRVVEENHVVFDYVAAESKATGAILFRNAPMGRTVDIRAAGYTDP